MAETKRPVDYETRFRALSGLAISAAEGESVGSLLDQAVTAAVKQVGLIAGAVRIFGPTDGDLAGAISGTETGKKQLDELEATLLSQLRHNYSVRSLYMTLDLDGPAGLFSYPIRSGQKIFGSISGIATGERNLAVEEEFVSSLAAMIVLIGRSSSEWLDEKDGNVAARIKTEAVRETAAAVNHEINNPLMAVMGNVELLLRKQGKTDDDARDKLEKIHEAASRIRKVTQDLMRITEARSTPYPGGSSMIDIDASPKGDDEK